MARELGHIAFICSGNICRSPMAAGLCRQLFDMLDVRARITSAGTLGIDGHAAAEHAVRATLMAGVDIRAHRSRSVDLEYLQSADALVVMSDEHERTLRLLDPRCDGRIWRLWEHTEKPDRIAEISDPVGGDLEEFLACRDDIIDALRGWVRTYLEST